MLCYVSRDVANPDACIVTNRSHLVLCNSLHDGLRMSHERHDLLEALLRQIELDQ